MTSGGDVTIGLLGPLVAQVGGAPVHLGGAKPRAVLAVLALRPGTVVPVDEILTAVWGDDHGDGATASLQVHVSNLRKGLGPDVIATRPPGYVLTVPAEAVDHAAAEADLRVARMLRAGGDLDAAAAAVERVLGRWRGRPLADLADAPFAPDAATWLEERRLAAVEERAEVQLARGRHRDLVADLEREVAAAPYREALWGRLMVALYRSGRQAEALDAFQRARRVLGEALGIDPGPALRSLEASVLAHDPALDAGPEEAVTGRTARPATRAPVSDTTTVPAWADGERWLDRDGHAPVAVDGLVVLGRATDATVTLEGGSVSRRHAEVRPTVAGDLLVDLGSTNGTLVNGDPVTARVLVDGDIVTARDHTLRYRTE